MAEEQDRSKAEPKGESSAEGRKGDTTVTSPVPEKAQGQLNPSSPGDTGTTPGSTAEIG
jgi:hypothetical protein